MSGILKETDDAALDKNTYEIRFCEWISVSQNRRRQPPPQPSAPEGLLNLRTLGPKGPSILRTLTPQGVSSERKDIHEHRHLCPAGHHCHSLRPCLPSYFPCHPGRRQLLRRGRRMSCLPGAEDEAPRRLEKEIKKGAVKKCKSFLHSTFCISAAAGS